MGVTDQHTLRARRETIAENEKNEKYFSYVEQLRRAAARAKRKMAAGVKSLLSMEEVEEFEQTINYLERNSINNRDTYECRKGRIKAPGGNKGPILEPNR